MWVELVGIGRLKKNLGNVVSNKNYVPLNEFILLQRGFDLPQSDRISGDIPVVASTGVAGFHNEYKVDAPGVVIGRSGSIGGGQYIKEKFWPLNTTLWVKDFKGHDARYVYYLLKSIDFHRFNVGTGVPTLNRNHLSSVLVKNLGYINEKVIAKTLGDLDDKIHLNNQINQTLESIAQALFKSWFIDFDPVRAKIVAKQEGNNPEFAAMCVISGKSEVELQQMAEDDLAELRATAALFPDELVESELGEVPKGWEVSTVGEQVQAVGGGTPSTKNADFWDNGIHYWTTPKDLSNLTDKILLNTERKLTDTGLKKISSGLLPKNTVLMSSRAPVGYLALAKIEVAINQGYIAILPNTKYSAEYLIQWCEANMAEIKGRASGTTFLEISKKNFREINFICSDEKVVTVYTKTAKTLYDEISLKAEENQSLINLRDTLLPKLLSGELEVLT